MRTGRPKKPDAIKKLSGTLQKCRQTQPVEAVQAMAPLSAAKPPAWLSPVAKKVFKEKAAQLISLRALTLLDIDMLAAYAAAYARMIDAIKQLEDGSIVTENYNKGLLSYAVSPFEKIKNDAIKIVNQIGAQFGFTPASRASILASLPKNQDKDDFDEF